MISINLRLFATLTQYLPESHETFQVDRGTDIDTLIQILGIPKDETKLIFVNGKKQEPAYMLEPGDRVGIFPPVGGG